MRPAAFVLAGLLVAAVQAVALRWLGGGAVPLQLLAACVVWLGLETEGVEGVTASAGIGWVMDLFAATPKGLFTFLAVVLFLASRAGGIAVDLRGRAGFAVMTGAGCLLLAFGALFLQRWAGLPEAAPGGALVPRILGEALLTALASPAIRYGLNRLDGLLGREEPGLVP